MEVVDVEVSSCSGGRTLRGAEKGTQPNEQTQSPEEGEKALILWQLQYLYLPAGRRWYSIHVRTLNRNAGCDMGVS